MTLLADWQLQGPLLALWPYRTDVWRAAARHAQHAILEMLQRVAPYHPVQIGIHPPELQRALLRIPPQLEWTPLRYDDSWVRDSGPQFKAEFGRYAAVAGEFDGWQGVHSVYQRDRSVSRQLSHRFAYAQQNLPFVFEGGMLTHDGNGTAIVHARSLRSRNPQWRQEQLERRLKLTLSLQRVIWIETNLRYDETGGHVDNQLQFLSGDTIAYALSSDDPNWNQEVQRMQQQSWAKAYRWLQLPTTQSVLGNRRVYVDITKNRGVRERGHEPHLASYVNCIRLPQALVVPQFAVPQCQQDNQRALKLLSAHFTELPIVPVDATEMIRGGGGPHCLSLVLPG